MFFPGKVICHNRDNIDIVPKFVGFGNHFINVVIHTIIYDQTKFVMAVPWLWRLVTGLSPPQRRFAPGSVHVWYVVDEVALGQVSLRVLRFSPVSFILL
jgi:hypothetical protein